MLILLHGILLYGTQCHRTPAVSPSGDASSQFASVETGPANGAPGPTQSEPVDSVKSEYRAQVVKPAATTAGGREPPQPPPPLLLFGPKASQPTVAPSGVVLSLPMHAQLQGPAPSPLSSVTDVAVPELHRLLPEGAVLVVPPFAAPHTPLITPEEAEHSTSVLPEPMP